MQRLYRVLQGLLVLLIVLLLCVFVLGRGPGTLVWLTGSPPAWLPIAGAGIDWLPLLSASDNNPKPSPSATPSGGQTPNPTPDASPSASASPEPSPSPSPSIELPSPSPAPAPSPTPSPAPSVAPSPSSSPSPAPSPTPSPLSLTATASPTSGNFPLLVSFTSTPSGGTAPYSYAWTFGDGGTSTAANPTHTYATNGTFSAAITVTDSAAHTKSYPAFTITVGIPPLAAHASASPGSGVTPLLVSFTGSATGGVSPYTYAWDFGDGIGTSTAQNPTYTYAFPGSYTITLVVTDATLATASALTTVTTTLPPLTASASAVPTSGLAPLDVAFTGSAAGGTGPYTYSWDFGDGSGTSTAQNPPYTYNLPGTYTVTLTVTDSTTPTPGTATASVIITVQPPVPSITGLSPNFGPETGGTTVTISGTYFENASAVAFGTKSATIVGGSLTCDASGNCSIQATSPSQAAGTVAVTVTTPGGTTPKQNDQFSYLMAWTQSTPATSPPAREGAAMANDAGTVVLFGGDDGVVPLGDTWTWNGTTWTAGPLTGPTARSNASLTYYSDAGAAVLFGGCPSTILGCTLPLNDTWTWNGSTWTQITPNGTAPSARTGASMAYDPKNHQLLLFGGFSGTTYLTDTWALSYNTKNLKWTWTQLVLAGPSARAYSASGTDASGQVVIFGGYNGTSVLGDTWLWTGTAWGLAPFGQNPAPSARQMASMGFFKNPKGGSASGLALFGGLTGAIGSGTPQSDTWTWNGTTWSLLPTSGAAPSARYDAAAAQDTNGGVLVVGGNTGGAVNGETWRLG